MDVPAYLERIEYDGPLEPGIATLRALHRRHLLAVPFENLDIHLGRPISLDEEQLFEKIVLRRRGGFCYELNALFASLLRALGYSLTYLSARVAHHDGGYGPEFDHLTLLVHLPGSGTGLDHIQWPGSAPARWLADVGFGDSFCEPLHLDEHGPQQDPRGAFRIVNEGVRRILWQRRDDGAWERNYCFTLQPRGLQDFAAMCHFHQASPESGFTRRRIATRATPQGRIALSDTQLTITEHGTRVERPVKDDAEYRLLLRQFFDLELPPS